MLGISESKHSDQVYQPASNGQNRSKMRYLAIMLIVVAVSFAVDPIGKNENNILYGWDGYDYEVYQENVGLFSITESVNGADSVGVWFDVATGTYDHYEVLIWASVTGDATDEDMTAQINFYPAGEYATTTAGDTLNWVNMNSDGDVFGTVRYTITTVTGDTYQIGGLVPGETFSSPAMFWLDGTAATDSTGYIFEVITSDSCEVTITGLAIPRT